MSVAHHEDMLQDLYDDVVAEFPQYTEEQCEAITLQRWEDQLR